jgi:hypothetical protein
LYITEQLTLTTGAHHDYINRFAFAADYRAFDVPTDDLLRQSADETKRARGTFQTIPHCTVIQWHPSV